MIVSLSTEAKRILALEDFVLRGPAGHEVVLSEVAFELKADRSFVDPGRPAFRMRGLFDRDRPVDPKGVIEGKVRPVYLTMITSRGFYLAGHGRTAEARLAFEEALTLDPGFSPARQALASLSAP